MRQRRARSQRCDRLASMVRDPNCDPEERVMRFGGRAIRSWMLIGTLLVGIGIGATGQRLVAAPPSFTETVLLRSDLAGMDKYELIVSRLETAPGWAHGRHYHAGHEIVYVLEGNGVLDAEGKSEQPLRPGTVSYVPPGQVHAGRNPGVKEAFKFLLFRIHV